MSYIGRSSKLFQRAYTKVSFLATAGQTSKTGLSYTPTFVEVYVNGVLLTDTTDFTATNGNSVTFTVALLLNDEVTVVSLKTFTVADHYNKTEADTLLAAKSPLASPSFTGSVGIGTSSPSTKLEVKSGYISQTDGTITTYMGSDGNGSLFGTTTNHYQRFITNNTERLRIDSSGNVMVGGDASSTVAGVKTQSVGRIYLSRGTGTGGFGHLIFMNGNGSVGSVVTSGSSTSYNTSSDYRLKTNVTPMTGATAAVKLLKPCNFDWISSGDNVNGFLAHELAEVVPEAATGTKDAMMDEEYEVTPAVLDVEGNETTPAVMGTRSVPDMQGIDQSKLVPLLTATIQELIARIETLEGE
jgi:hypothetical protein